MTPRCCPFIFKSFNPALMLLPSAEARGGSKSGLWLAFLVPIILLRTGHQSLAVDILVTTCVLFAFLSETHSALLFTSGLGLSLLFAASVNPMPPFRQLFILSFTICAARTLLRLFPKSFTFGEALLLAHLITVFIHSSPIFLIIFICSFVVEYYSIPFTAVSFLSMSFLTSFLYLALVTSFLPGFLFLHTLKLKQFSCFLNVSSITLLMSWASLLLFSIAVVLHYRHSNRHLIQSDSKRVTLRSSVSDELSSDCGPPEQEKNSLNYSEPSNSSPESCLIRVPSTPFWIRKVFHFAAGNVFALGLQIEPWLLSFCAACLLIVFVLFEWSRRRGPKIVSQCLNDLVDPFRDERDSGAIVFTPIALLLGLSLPLWWPEPVGPIYSVNVALRCPKWSVPPYAWAGVLSIAVGDSMAALIGRRWGRKRWPGSHRTFVGSTASLLSQYILWIPLARWNGWPIRSGLFPILLGVLVEAHTDQIDNLVVPLVVMAAFASPT